MWLRVSTLRLGAWLGVGTRFGGNVIDLRLAAPALVLSTGQDPLRVARWGSSEPIAKNTRRTCRR
jgi:hypothetical protein